jgi:hypothetical protein
MKKLLYLALGMATFHFVPAQSEELLIKTKTGELLSFDVDLEKSFWETAETIEAYLKDYENAKSLKMQRDYNKPLTEKEEKTLIKILLTLANDPLKDIWSKRKSLKKSGDSLRHIHPLRFLEKCYSEERLVAAMCSIVGKTFVWGDFKEGLYDALTEEFGRGNLHPHLEKFSDSVRVTHDSIKVKVDAQDWDGLMKTLNDYAPRTGDPRRYGY